MIPCKSLQTNLNQLYWPVIIPFCNYQQFEVCECLRLCQIQVNYSSRCQNHISIILINKYTKVPYKYHIRLLCFITLIFLINKNVKISNHKTNNTHKQISWGLHDMYEYFTNNKTNDSSNKHFNRPILSPIKSQKVLQIISLPLNII